MIHRKKSKNTYMNYSIPIEDYRKIEKLGLFGGVCDQCSAQIDEESHYIPVLDYLVCKGCFKEWEERSLFYEEDSEYESKNIDRWDKAFSDRRLGVGLFIDNYLVIGKGRSFLFNLEAYVEEEREKGNKIIVIDPEEHGHDVHVAKEKRQNEESDKKSK